MSDVFISYAREDRLHAETLATDLQSRGYRVWWDAELVGSDNFQDVILTALAQAKAAIVIWSPASVKSLFVRDEARFALHHKKLIAVRTAGLDTLDIPFGFQSQQTDELQERGQILKAIAKLGVAPTTQQAVGKGEMGLDALRSTNDPKTLMDWLEQNPSQDGRVEVMQRLRQLFDAGQARNSAASIARTSNWSAFWSGLTFRVPKFQLSTQGKWSSIGFSLGLTILLLAFTWVVSKVNYELIVRFGFPGRSDYRFYVARSPLLLACLLMLFITKKRFDGWIRQRDFVAAAILSPFMAFLAFVSVGAACELALGNVPNLTLSSGLFGAILLVIYMIRKYRAAR